MGFQVSPGVNVSEIDLTTIVPAVSTTEAGFAAHLRWGPAEQRVLVTNEDDLVADFQKPFYRRMRYPDTYKCDTMFISKFEKNAKRILRYQFINAFPKSITPQPVQYGPADLLKVNVSFNYDRYIVANKLGL